MQAWSLKANSFASKNIALEVSCKRMEQELEMARQDEYEMRDKMLATEQKEKNLSHKGSHATVMNVVLE